MVIQERYHPLPIGANATVDIKGSSIGGFLCTANGTLTIVANAADGKPQTTIVNAMAVTAGNFYRIPFYLGINGGTATTATNAAGTLAVA